ncbi:hypothetical protein H5410_032515 [Solanum commersonii]|uniref:DUF4283 domain-containing protein n=1 Tax=Solanum commersonii TaxID=4109 RepID=A0A9J5YL98_SOLCO|nr:hypothetical protein H5410_032515 [Solanum commersonii]
MAGTTAGGSVPPEEFPPLPTKSNHESQTTIPQNIIQYATLLKPKPTAPSIINVPPKLVFLLHGEPSITWKTSEVRLMIVKENLQYAIVGNFSYGKPEIKELRKVILGQCGVKSDGLLCEGNENYWQVRTLKWDPWFEPDVETTIGVTWISFPDLPPNFFAKEAIFSIASAVGKPLTVDMATKNQTRPSCARIKIEVDLTAKLPQRIQINEEDDNTGVVKLNGKQKGDQQKEGRENITMGTTTDQRKVLASGKVVGNKQNSQEWMVRRNKYKKDRYRHIEGEIIYHDENSFEALREDDEHNNGATTGDETKVGNTKDRVTKTFGQSEKTDDPIDKDNHIKEKNKENKHGNMEEMQGLQRQQEVAKGQ